MTSIIKPEHELCEIINAFPVLKEKLEKLNFNLSSLKDGISVEEFLKQKNCNYDEINIIIKNLNSSLNYFLKKGDLPKTEIKKLNVINQNDDGNLVFPIGEEEE